MIPYFSLAHRPMRSEEEHKAEHAIAERIEAGAEALFAAQDKWIATLQSTPVSNREAHRTALNEEIEPLYHSTYTALEELLNSKATLGTARIQFLRYMTNVTVVAGSIIILIAVAISIAFGVVIARRIVRSVTKLVDASKKTGLRTA